MKKAILALALLAALIGAGVIGQRAIAATEYTVTKQSMDGMWTYGLTPQREVIIQRYLGTSTSVTIPAKIDGYKVIGGGGLNEKVTQLIISADVARIDRTWLSGASGASLKVVYLPSSAETIAPETFKDFPSLTEIHMPGVKEIGNKAFYQCTSLRKVSLGSKLETIGEHAFDGCNLLPSFTFGLSIKTIGQYAFANCAKLAALEFRAAPETIGASAFQNCPALTGLSIPDGPCAIGTYAFYKCTELSSVRLPEGLTALGAQAFNQCGKLTSLQIPASLTSIGANALPASVLEEVTFADGLAEIGSGWFSSCKKIASIDIPGSVTSIADRAFYGCEALETVHLAQGLLTIGDSAFRNCTALTSVAIPDSVERIGQWAFGGCSAIASADLGEGLHELGANAFDSCSSLSYVYLGGNLQSIGGWAFYACRALTGVNLPSSLRTVGEAGKSPFAGSGVKSLSIPEGVTTVGGGFDQKKIYLPRTLNAVSGTFKRFDSLTPMIYCYEGSFADRYAQDNQIDLCYLDDSYFSEIGALTVESMALNIGETARVRYSLFPDDGGEVRYSTTNSRVAVVSADGMVYGVGRGTAYVGVQYGDYTAHARVRVRLPITELTLEDVYAVAKEDVYVTPVYAPENADVDFSYSVDKATVTIDADGLFHSYWKTTASITVTDAVSGLSATCGVFVSNPVTAITLDAEEISLQARESAVITATVETGDQTYVNKLVRFHSSDTTVATVDGNGRVTGRKGGHAVITVSAGNGVTATCLVAVEDPIELRIPDGVTEIAAEAFAGGGFTAAYVPDSCRVIGSRAFAANVQMTKIYLPAELDRIANDAFAQCYRLVIVAPEGSRTAAWAVRHGFTVEFDPDR